jgi:basic membrane lipoprotein Med (substrate-binding protein (PBP1-ABC) superfamily)
VRVTTELIKERRIKMKEKMNVIFTGKEYLVRIIREKMWGANPDLKLGITDSAVEDETKLIIRGEFSTYTLAKLEGYATAWYDILK